MRRNADSLTHVPAAAPRGPVANRASRVVRSIVLGVVLGMSLCACSDMYYDRRESITFQAGDAVRANVIAQTIDPWSRASADRHIDYNGERMQRAIERYRTNKTTPLMTTSTSSVATPPGQAAPATPTP